MSTFINGVHKASSVEPTVLTHTVESWVENKLKLDDPTYKCVKYLGRCPIEGDMFAAYTHTNEIVLYKGIVGNEFG